MRERNPPEGFIPSRTDGSFNDVVSPLYIRDSDFALTFGLYVEKKHCNPINICHGGALMTLLDMALSSAVCHKLGKYCGTPTINLSVDFISAARESDWIEVDIQSINLTNTMGFASGMVTGPDGDIARASGCFKLPRDVESTPGMTLEEYRQYRSEQQ